MIEGSPSPNKDPNQGPQDPSKLDGTPSTNKDDPSGLTESPIPKNKALDDQNELNNQSHIEILNSIRKEQDKRDSGK